MQKKKKKNGSNPEAGMLLNKADKTVECSDKHGEKQEIEVPNRETLLRYHPGDSTFRVCGWCKFSGSGQEMKIPNTDHKCLIIGKCVLIPLPINNKSLLPPVRLSEGTKSKRLAEYRKFNKIERMNVKQFKQNLKIIGDMRKSIENTSDEDIDNIDVVKWNTRCLFVRSLQNKTFRNEVITRNQSWMDEYNQRIEDRKRYIDSLRKGKSKNELSEV